MTPIFYDPRQNVAGLDSFSPSAGKPARFVELMQHFAYHAYGPQQLGRVEPVAMADLYTVHRCDHVDAVFAGEASNGFGNADPRVPESCLWTIGSLLAAARFALSHPHIPACSPTSGFHHAGYAHSGGYCTFNGLMTVAAKLIGEQHSLRIGILDCDFHYGDGTADILDHMPDLADRVMHHSSGQYFHDDADPNEFFLWLQESIADMNAFGCDLVLYQAGADMHKADPLGGLLDTAQMEQRDRMVFCGIKGAVAFCLAGGYQPSKDGSIFADPVLRLHHNTLQASNGSIKSRAS